MYSRSRCASHGRPAVRSQKKAHAAPPRPIPLRSGLVACCSSWSSHLVPLPKPKQRPADMPANVNVSHQRASLQVAAPGHAPFRNPQRNAGQWRAPAARNSPRLPVGRLGRAPVPRCCFFSNPPLDPCFSFPLGATPSLPLSCFSLLSCLAYLKARFLSWTTSHAHLCTVLYDGGHWK